MAAGLVHSQLRKRPDSPRAQWLPGTEGALRLFAAFLERALPTFDADRAKTDRESTSRLSPHIHFGEISVRAVAGGG